MSFFCLRKLKNLFLLYVRSVSLRDGGGFSLWQQQQNFPFFQLNFSFHFSVESFHCTQFYIIFSLPLFNSFNRTFNVRKGESWRKKCRLKMRRKWSSEGENVGEKFSISSNSTYSLIQYNLFNFSSSPSSLSVITAATTATTSCVFPQQWNGSWFQSTEQQPITFSGSVMSSRGRCIASEGDKYLLVNE